MKSLVHVFCCCCVCGFFFFWGGGGQAREFFCLCFIPAQIIREMMDLDQYFVKSHGPCCRLARAVCVNWYAG